MPDFEIEKNIFLEGINFLGAIDEAGRGPLAGPVVAACVICRSDFNYKSEELVKINDSKKITGPLREKLYSIIFDNFFEVGVGVCSPETVDRINVLQASFLAMKKAIGVLKQKPEFVILDGSLAIPNLSIKQKAVTRGDSLSVSIAAASIIAKVTRDRLMEEADKKYPEYGFAKHKGYGTKLHLENLKQHGPCKIHRRSFAPVKKLLNKNKKITC